MPRKNKKTTPDIFRKEKAKQIYLANRELSVLEIAKKVRSWTYTINEYKTNLETIEREVRGVVEHLNTYTK